MPLDTVELTTEFGTLNFEDIMPTETGTQDVTPFEEDYYDNAEDEFEEPEFEIEQESDFEVEMKKVVEIMKIAGNDLSANSIKTMVTDLVTKAREESKSREEQIGQVSH